MFSGDKTLTGNQCQTKNPYSEKKEIEKEERKSKANQLQKHKPLQVD